MFDFSQTAELDDDEVAGSVELSPKLDSPEQMIALNDSETALEIKDVPINGHAQEPEQVVLFEKGEWWEEAWKGMPGFIQKDLQPLKSLWVHFESREDLVKFAALLGQQIGINTPFIWYPEKEYGVYYDKRWVAAAPIAQAESDDVDYSEADE
jgi:hypothetical protein